MSLALDEKEPVSHRTGNSIEASLNRLSEKLGEDEAIFWQIISISKGDSQVPAKVKVGDSWLNSTEFTERLSQVIWLNCMNGEGMSRDIGAAKAFLGIIHNKMASNGDKEGINNV